MALGQRHGHIDNSVNFMVVALLLGVFVYQGWEHLGDTTKTVCIIIASLSLLCFLLGVGASSWPSSHMSLRDFQDEPDNHESDNSASDTGAPNGTNPSSEKNSSEE